MINTQNKEENPAQCVLGIAPAMAVAFCSAKQGGKSSAPAMAVAFCSAKQGGFYVR